MPPPNQRAVPPVKKSIGQIIDEQGLYPREAFDFLQRGLKFTSDQIHRELRAVEPSVRAEPLDRQLGRHVRPRRNHCSRLSQSIT